VQKLHTIHRYRYNSNQLCLVQLFLYYLIFRFEIYFITILLQKCGKMLSYSVLYYVIVLNLSLTVLKTACKHVQINL